MIRRTRTDLLSIDQYKRIKEQGVIFPEVGKPNKLFYKLIINWTIFMKKRS